MITQQSWVKKLDKCLRSEDVKTTNQCKKKVRKWFGLCVSGIIRYNPTMKRSGIVNVVGARIATKFIELENELVFDSIRKSNEWQEDKILLLCGLQKVVREQAVRRYVLNTLARRSRKLREKEERKKRKKIVVKRKHVKMIKDFIRRFENG